MPADQCFVRLLHSSVYHIMNKDNLIGKGLDSLTDVRGGIALTKAAGCPSGFAISRVPPHCKSSQSCANPKRQANIIGALAFQMNLPGGEMSRSQLAKAASFLTCPLVKILITDRLSPL